MSSSLRGLSFFDIFFVGNIFREIKTNARQSLIVLLSSTIVLFCKFRFWNRVCVCRCVCVRVCVLWLRKSKMKTNGFTKDQGRERKMSSMYHHYHHHHHNQCHHYHHHHHHPSFVWRRTQEKNERAKKGRIQDEGKRKRERERTFD